MVRTYFKEGTNGVLHLIQFDKVVKICFTIELPWLENKKGISCIPEGRYELVKRYSPRYKWHIHLKGVPARQLILIHPANHARKELKGCIAPVSTLTGPGRGDSSRLAMQKLKSILYAELEKKKKVFIIIKSKPNESK